MQVSVAAESNAAQEGAVQIELNKLEPNGEACRAYVLLENKTAIGFQSLKLDLVMFDNDGIVAKRLAVETAPLPAGKTSLKVFDAGAIDCAEIGRVLLNDVLACADTAAAREDCLDLLTASSRAHAGFLK